MEEIPSQKKEPSSSQGKQDDLLLEGALGLEYGKPSPVANVHDSPIG